MIAGTLKAPRALSVKLQKSHWTREPDGLALDEREPPDNWPRGTRSERRSRPCAASPRSSDAAAGGVEVAGERPRRLHATAARASPRRPRRTTTHPPPLSGPRTLRGTTATRTHAAFLRSGRTGLQHGNDLHKKPTPATPLLGHSTATCAPHVATLPSSVRHLTVLILKLSSTYVALQQLYHLCVTVERGNRKSLYIYSLLTNLHKLTRLYRLYPKLNRSVFVVNSD